MFFQFEKNMELKPRRLIFNASIHALTLFPINILILLLKFSHSSIFYKEMLTNPLGYWLINHLKKVFMGKKN